MARKMQQRENPGTPKCNVTGFKLPVRLITGKVRGKSASARGVVPAGTEATD
jgi:hypothetical protein